jgi:hypothetical protein
MLSFEGMALSKLRIASLGEEYWIATSKLRENNNNDAENTLGHVDGGFRALPVRRCS